MQSQALADIINSLQYFLPELIVTVGLLLVLVLGFIPAIRNTRRRLYFPTLIILVLVILADVTNMSDADLSRDIFLGALHVDGYSSSFKILLDLGALLTVILSLKSKELNAEFTSEYVALVLSVLLGAHLLTMSSNFLVLFISLEIISIPSYVLAGFGSGKKSGEASLKYFLFGAVASAIMLYGFSILYGLSGTMDFSSGEFIELINKDTPLVLVSGMMVLSGFLYKAAAAPLHLWAPDVYEASPMPLVALFSVVPKLAGIAALSKFALALNGFDQSTHDWQLILCAIAVLSLTIGNFSALWQDDPKRMLAYSSVAQSGFMLTGIVTFTIQGYQFTLFYGAIYLVANFAVFAILSSYAAQGVLAISAFRGWGRKDPLGISLLSIGLIALAGIPPTAGFMSKLFIFSSVYEAYADSGKSALFVLLLFGLLNTVVGIFYYLKIPYYAFFKPGLASTPGAPGFGLLNYLAFFLVIVVFILFIRPDLLMGWLNTINFVL